MGAASTPLWGLGLFYRVNHAEFHPRHAYRAIAHLDYGETANHQLLFVNERGMTWAVDVRCTLCINSIADEDEASNLWAWIRDHPNQTWGKLDTDELKDAPWPQPRRNQVANDEETKE